MVRRSRKRRYAEPHPELNVDALMHSSARVESNSDGRRWHVRNVSGSHKTYRCPGCQQEIRPEIAHVVAWREDNLFGDDLALENRRHWHTACWQARERRGPR